MSDSLNVDGAKGFSRTLLAGSDDDPDAICEFCQGEGKRIEAAGYCVDCREYLCHECKTNHTKTSATKTHILKDNLDMSTKGTDGKQHQRYSDVSDPLTYTCQIHPEEFIKLFCHTHKQLGCSICISLNHRTCDDVSYIRDISSGMVDSEELKHIQSDLKKILAALGCSKSRSTWSQRETEASYIQMVTEVKLFRQGINQLLDKLEKELIDNASRLRNECLDFFSCQAPKCDAICVEISEMISDLDKKNDLKHYSQLFIAMESAKEKLAVLEKEAAAISLSIRTQRFVFKRDDKLGSITSSITSLGTLSVVSKQVATSAKYLHDISIKSNTDTENCFISGIVVLPDGRLAMSDHYNKSVKLVNLSDKNISEQVKLASEPLDITLIGDNQLAVLFDNKDLIQFLNLLPILSESHTITMRRGLYIGITYSEGKLILASHKPTSVHICDMSGNLLQQLDQDNTGNALFTGAPAYITTSPDQSMIYVSDFQSNKVIVLNSAGVVLATHVNESLRRPTGLALDDDGYVYVCSTNAHSVHLLSPSGQLCRILLEEKDGVKLPQAITHTAGKLYISSANKNPAYSNNIKVYRLFYCRIINSAEPDQRTALGNR